MYTLGVCRALSKELCDELLSGLAEDCEDRSGEKAVEENDGDGPGNEGVWIGGNDSWVGAVEEGSVGIERGV